VSSLLEIDDLVVEYSGHGGLVRAVDHVSLAVERGQIYGLVGESGCGKSAICLSVLGLFGPGGRIAGGQVRLEGLDLAELPRRDLRRIRGNAIAMIFQDPSACLNPIMKVGRQLAEAIRVHERVTPAAARDRVLSLLRRVGLPDAEIRFEQYPYQLSGGIQQRVMIAMAMLNRPKLLIADEPVTALDVTIQSEILALIEELRDESGTAVLLVTHDMGVVAEVCDKVGVVYAGRLIEEGDALSVIGRPSHPYSKGLLGALPRFDPSRPRLRDIPGSVDSARHLGAGCRFRPRCAEAMAICEVVDPVLTQIDEDLSVACHLYEGAGR
jgi:oligopeptide/dipeptide ABC transporter ATP-binding protein